MTEKQNTRYMVFTELFLAGTLFLNADNLRAEKRIEVNIPSYELKLYEGNTCITGFPVRVGKPATPTPLGEGTIYEKRDDIRFFYLEGEKEGQRIEESFIVPKARFENVPYKNMRALAIDFAGDKSKVIHSTTDYWTIGLPKSHGCIGMNIDDMLALYGCIDKIPIAVDVKYKTFNADQKTITFYADIYRNAGNELKELSRQIKIQDIISASNRIEIIRQELRNNLKKISKGLEAGKDMSSHKKDLSITLSLSDFLKPCKPEFRVQCFEVAEGDGMIDCLVKGGIKRQDAVEVSGKLGIDPRKLQIGDSFRARFLENNLKSIEYTGIQGKKYLDLK